MTVLFCPGRTTKTHKQFIKDFPGLKDMQILTLDTGSADLAYESGSTDLIFCSNEKYHLEVHKLLNISPAHKYIRENWEDKFNHGKDWIARGKFLAAFNNEYRPMVFNTWNAVSQYYCILCMSSFYVNYDKWRLLGEYSPVIPEYENIRKRYENNKEKRIRYYKSNIYNFPINQLDDNGLIYLHLPTYYASYGCGYVWTKRKFESITKDLSELAELGHKICVSFTEEKWGRKVTNYRERFSDSIFIPHEYSELKASRYGFNETRTKEVYLVANL